jgi:DNA polymerase-3 subunit gamma/tau
MPLHLNWRPSKFEDFIGNESTVAALKSIFLCRQESQDFPHAMLFSGPSGCGKTTLARIVAKELGCNEMELCEIDNGDYRGIDTVRDLRQSINYAPAIGNCRVWIMDEAHQLSKDAQSALLKILEEPPKHVYFLICTTEPEKLLPAIRTRCTKYTVESLSMRTIFTYISTVVQQEGADVPSAVLTRIAQDAEGSMRVALVILDKIIDMNPADMLKAAEQQLYSENNIFKFYNALKDGSWKTASIFLQNLTDEPEAVRAQILGICAKDLLKKEDDMAYLIMSCFKESFFYTKKPGLIIASYEAVQTIKAKRSQR